MAEVRFLHEREIALLLLTAGVGKSFLIRALEFGIWELVKERFDEEEYPSIRTAIKLAAFTGKAAFQIGGVMIHSLLKIGDVYMMQELSEQL